MNQILFVSFMFIVFAFLILLIKPNLLFILFALEIILLGVNLNFICASFLLDDFMGQFLSLILFSLAAVDTSIGLVIILNYYNHRYYYNAIQNIKG
jgi:NADH-quinone oxidoreductase subunit K